MTFEIISPSELEDWRARDRKRLDVQGVEGVIEIVEIYQEQMALHLYRKTANGTWDFSQEGGASAILNLTGASELLAIPLTEIHEFAMPFDEAK